MSRIAAFFAGVLISNAAIARNIPFLFFPNKAIPTNIWTGLTGDSQWSNPGNWSKSAVPNSSQLAVFDGTYCVGANCNVSLDVNVHTHGFQLKSGYGGTITQQLGVTVDLESSGWIQSAGTFTGSNAAITINGGSFNQSGGTFTSTSSNFFILSSGTTSTVFNQTAGTFTAATGTLYFGIKSTGCINSSIFTINVNSTLAVNNLRLAGGHPSTANTCTWAIDTGDIMTVNGNLNLAIDQANGFLQASGDIEVKGDVTYGTGLSGGSINLTLNGTTDQNISAVTANQSPTASLTINKALGKAILQNNLDVSTLIISAGTYEQAAGVASTIGDLTQGVNSKYRWCGGSMSLGPVTLDPTSWLTLCSAGGWNIGGLTFENLEIDTGGTLSMLSMSWSVNHNFKISNGVFDLNGNSISVAGDWINNASFTANGGVVYLQGGDQAISGSNTFYDLYKFSFAADTLTFTAGATQTVTNFLVLIGTSAAARLKLRSSTPSSAWNINASGTRSITFLDVQDSNNTSGTTMAATDRSLDSGNNTDWSFAATERILFATSNTYDGNLGGISGADTECANAAIGSGLYGTYKAWLGITTGATVPATTFTTYAIPYQLPDGTPVAANWAGLISGTLSNAIDEDEWGVVVGAEDRWTNVATNGTASSSGSSNTENCTGWTSANAARSGRYGSAGSTSGTWTDNGATTAACNTSKRIICVQQ